MSSSSSPDSSSRGCCCASGSAPGGIDLAAFYARRIRRLLPAATIVIVVTLIGSVFAVAPTGPAAASRIDGASAALWVSNLRFASQGGYFAVAGDPSPFLHFWSLSVEEQFYLFWPVLLIAATRLPRPRLWAGVLLAIVGVASFVSCVWLTDVAPDWAFYLLRDPRLGAGAGRPGRGRAALAPSRRALLGLLAWAGPGRGPVGGPHLLR